MTAAAYPGPFAPDNPLRRLPWILVISVLLVLLALLGLGRILHPPARRSAKPKPLLARIYELPASRGAVAATPVPGGRHAARARTAHRRVPLPSTRRPANVSIPHVAPSTTATLAQPGHTHARQAISTPAPRPASSSAINWATLQSQINTAVRQSESSLPQIHDPHTLVARYYIASLLLKLQRIGDMNDPTNHTGMPVIRLVIGAHGELQQLTLLQSSGDDSLDQDALQIARESAPFAPFPDKLKRQTHHIELVCYMKFVGYRQLYAGY